MTFRLLAYAPRSFWAVVLLSCLGACPGAGTGEGPVEPFPPRRVRPLELTLPRLGGGQVSLSGLRGGPVVLTMFTTWSLRCQAEAPQFVQLHERWKSRGLRVVGVSLSADDASLVRTYVEFVGYRFDVALARPDDLELVAAFGLTRQVPRTVLLDGAGRVLRDFEGLTDFVTLRRELDALLGAGSSKPPASTIDPPPTRR